LSQRAWFFLLFLGLLAFRTFFGFSQSFFAPDEIQTYLTGLKCYCEHSWPYFGPDLIVTETGFYTQIPGALEGLVVGGPLYLCPIPEAPFIFLNLLSLCALALLSWYIYQRMKNIPLLFIFTWLALLPWNLHESTSIINPSWLLFGGTFFFIGFLEAFPPTSLGRWSPFSAFAAMGFGLFWDMQFHFSWILLPPFIVVALTARLLAKERNIVQDLGGFVAGALISGAFLIPTWIVYGLYRSGQGLNLSVPFNWGNVKAFFIILARYFSLVSYEVPRFIGMHTNDRIQALKSLPLWIPPTAFLWIVGYLQPFVLVVLTFNRGKDRTQKGLRDIVLGAFLLVWISFWFTRKEPYAHIYYILIPLLSVYSFDIWDRLSVRKPWRILGLVCLFASLWFALGWGIHQAVDGSLYTNRSLVVQAIDQKNYHLLGERRPGAIY